tara:strand:- start:306 stop:1307 length:1002 start_codon:yes stop_codon:yes gene_type:complete
MNKVLILKNDRVGDYITSINSINLILNKHIDSIIHIFLSKNNYKFNFLFKKLKISVFNYDLKVFEKFLIFYFILTNKISDVYILAPKNFYYYLPFIFRRIKFHGICIDSDKSRPNSFLKKYLHSTSTLYRTDRSKIISTYKAQEKLINYKKNIQNFIHLDFPEFKLFDFPKNATFFHYKHALFKKLLLWDTETIVKFILFLASKKDFIVFSSELNFSKENEFFKNNFNSYDFKLKKFNKISSKNILFLDNIEGKDLLNMINLSTEVIAPEGAISHMGSFLNKKTLSLMHFNFKNPKSIFRQINDLIEWSPRNFKFLVLRKNLHQSLTKMSKRI